MTGRGERKSIIDVRVEEASQMVTMGHTVVSYSLEL